MTQTITVYSLPDCISCELTLRAFRRRGIEPTEVPMTDAKLEEFKAQGAMSAPVVIAAGFWWYGLRPDLIQEASNAVKREAMGRSRGDERARPMGAQAP